MNATVLPTYPVTIGQRRMYVAYATGPKSYDQAGDVIYVPAGVYIDAAFDTMSVSKNYIVRAFPSAVGGRATWAFKWYSAAGTEVNAATDLSAEQVQFAFVGGEF